MKSLHYIKLPFKLNKIGDNAFYNTGLKNINMVMPPLVNDVGVAAFKSTNISGSVIFLGTMAKISIGTEAFYGNGKSVTSAIFGEGITHISVGINRPFGESSAYVKLPSTLTYVGASITNGVLVIYSYAPTPPEVDDRFGLSSIKGLFVPAGSFNAYVGPTNGEQFDSFKYPWRVYYSLDPEYNRVWDCL